MGVVCPEVVVVVDTQIGFDLTLSLGMGLTLLAEG